MIAMWKGAVLVLGMAVVGNASSSDEQEPQYFAKSNVASIGGKIVENRLGVVDRKITEDDLIELERYFEVSRYVTKQIETVFKQKADEFDEKSKRAMVVKVVAEVSKNDSYRHLSERDKSRVIRETFFDYFGVGDLFWEIDEEEDPIDRQSDE